MIVATDDETRARVQRATELKYASQALRGAFGVLAHHHRCHLNVVWQIDYRMFDQAEGYTTFVFQCFQNLNVPYGTWGRQKRGTPIEYEGKGNGRLALNDVCLLADRLGVRLVLWTVYEPLYPYYESFGFTAIQKLGIAQWYERLPATTPVPPPPGVVSSDDQRRVL